MNSPLTVKASIKQSDTELLISYEISNPTDRDAYLLNRLYRTIPSITISPDIIYAEFDPATKTLLLSKQIPDIPKTVNVNSPKSPFVTPLHKGEVFREEVHIALPVKEYKEYNIGPKSSEWEVTRYEHIRFSVQYFWRTEGMTENTRDIGGVPVVVPTGGSPLKASDFGMLTILSEPISVPVLAPKS